MTCRAPTGTQVCTSSTQTGAALTYDVEGRLIQWVSPSGTTTDKFGYDGEGHRFEQQVTSGSTTTTTTYIGNLQENQTIGSTTTKTVYFYFGGQRVAEDQNTNWYYPITDGLTSTTVVVNFNGVVAAQMFGPYGQLRWAGGTMPTTFAYTGQRADSATGLDYYNSRYYDPSAGRFTSTDTMIPGRGMDPVGLDSYAYTRDNPTTYTDPSGHCIPWCLVLGAALLFAVLDYGLQVYNNYQHQDPHPWTHVDWGQVIDFGFTGALLAAGGWSAGVAFAEAAMLGASWLEALSWAGGAFLSCFAGGACRGRTQIITPQSQPGIDDPHQYITTQPELDEIRTSFNAKNPKTPLSQNRVLGNGRGNLTFRGSPVDEDGWAISGPHREGSVPPASGTGPFAPPSVGPANYPLKEQDVEFKIIFNNLWSKYGHDPYQLVGTYVISTERFPCWSCQGVGEQAGQIFPNLNLYFHWTEGKGDPIWP